MFDHSLRLLLFSFYLIEINTVLQYINAAVS